MKRSILSLFVMSLMLTSFTAAADVDYQRGDVSHDGRVSIDDVTYLIALLLNGDTSKSYADVDMNGVVNINDVSYLVNMLLGN